ncbi:MAG: GNAT family N-acetyltransferase [Bacteriovoracaceae bacterium]|nr:GNAT family N-acetyltransferase [Bacteriovoracaceae bacterium]
MGSIEIKKYSDLDKSLWDDFIHRSRNGIFLFERNFMDYHSDRFQDHSLFFFDNSKLVGLLPANSKGNIIYSHQGLTFGGLIYGIETKATTVGEIINELVSYYKANGFEEIIYKPTPYFLHSYPSQEDLYFWHLKGAKLIRRDLSSLIDLTHDYKYSKGRKWIINKAKKEGITVRLCNEWQSFYQILSAALVAHGTKPVHSVEELQLLSSRFPEDFRLFGAFLNDSLMAGAVTFKYGKTLHTQYLANSDKGRELGALDLLLDELVTISRLENYDYLSFGISTVDEGRTINNGLLQQKESYGGRGVLHDWYSCKL